MKKLSLTIFLSLAMVFAYAQKVKQDDVPQAVKDGLHKLYPDARVSKWELEDGNYEAEFENNKVETSVLLTPAGALVMTEVEIATSALPQAAQDYVKNNLGGKKIKEAAKITTAEGVVTYEAEIGGTDYLFDANGSFTGTGPEDKK